MNDILKRTLFVALAFATPTLLASEYAPEIWFHLIGGNVSKAGLSADLEAIKSAGFGGVQLFHGEGDDRSLWPGVTNGIPCLSPDWVDVVRFASEKCRRLGLGFKMQNCPGWSMSGGPWVSPRQAMRKLVAFEPESRPSYTDDDDYCEIGEVEFPIEDSSDQMLVLPNPQQISHHWAYEPDAVIRLVDGEREVFRRDCPMGAWQDSATMSFRMGGCDLSSNAYCVAESSHYGRKTLPWKIERMPKLDMWEAKAGWGLREFQMSKQTRLVKTRGTRRLVFGHVNAGRRNHPAPSEATGWECNKMDRDCARSHWAGYLGMLLKNQVRLDGTLIDSWECGIQSWTGDLECEFERVNGYALRPWLPALFGYVLKSEADTERFLLDWRRTCSRLVEDRYYGELAALAHKNGMTIQYESAFGDVVPGDPLRYWKYADEPMCEFWSPFDNANGFVYSHEFKPVLPCVSAAHVYGKRRVSAEAFTSFKLTFDETFQEWKENANRHFARGVTHLIFHTYTHNPDVAGKSPGSSFGSSIGSPFLRKQTWWPYLSGFVRYLERVGAELEKGLPEVDVLMYLGDAFGHRPREREDYFCNQYKCDYLNQDALMKRVAVRDGKIVLPDGMSYRVLWIPEGAYLANETVVRLKELSNQGAVVVYGPFEPDWEPQFSSSCENVSWYCRNDNGRLVYFVAARDHEPFRGAVRLRGLGEFSLDLAPGESRIINSSSPSEDMALHTFRELNEWDRPLGAWKDSPGTSADKAFSGTRAYSTNVALDEPHDRIWLDLGEVCNWATVKVNGEVVARLWCEPYRVEITDSVREGVNSIVVEVTSTWHNRLVYDASLPMQDRQTWTIKGPADDAPLSKSGLLGPVRLMKSSEQKERHMR